MPKGKEASSFTSIPMNEQRMAELLSECRRGPRLAA